MSLFLYFQYWFPQKRVSKLHRNVLSFKFTNTGRLHNFNNANFISRIQKLYRNIPSRFNKYHNVSLSKTCKSMYLISPLLNSFKPKCITGTSQHTFFNLQVKSNQLFSFKTKFDYTTHNHCSQKYFTPSNYDQFFCLITSNCFSTQ